MGGKKGGLEVYDFLMSIDYGLCHGPVDRINQVWVKDKPIWCGAASERMDVDVFQPDLFGGDSAEGGVVGVVEMYPGADDQVSSEALASRVGRTSATMPGYRGLAHLFFRGRGNNGFRWTTNNPYLPPMRASVTRSSPSLSETYKFIYAPVEDEEGNLVANPDAPDSLDPTAIAGSPLGSSPLIYYSSGLSKPADSVNEPYTRFTWRHIDEALIEYMQEEKGWTQQLHVQSNWDPIDSNSDVIPHTMRIYVDEYDRSGVLLESNSFNRSNGVEIDTTYAANPLTREVRTITVIDFNTSAYAGAIGDRAVEVFFTTDTSQQPLPQPGFYDAVQGPTHENAGTRINLLERYTIEAIDAGLVKLQISGSIGAQAAGFEVSHAGAFRFMGWEDSAGSPDFDGPELRLREEDSNDPIELLATNGTGMSHVSGPVMTIQPGTRWLTIYHEGAIAVGLSSWTMRYANLNLLGPGYNAPDVHCSVNGSLGILPDSNPAHMIYECLTNAEWGKGEDPSMIDWASFYAAAKTLYDEFFGLSMIWVRQTEIESFIQEILDHIRAVLYQDPATGLWTLTLLRNDYDAASAPLLNETNCTLSNRKRKAWGETINEIVATYTNPETEQEVAAPPSHNMGNIAIQGGVISETRNYYGVRNPILAKMLGDRDVESDGYPLFTTQASVDRSFWNLRPGKVVRLSWPQDGITEMVCRIMGINYGKPGDRKISLNLSEDIYAVEQTSYSGTQGSLLETQDRVAPAPLDTEMVVTAPLPSLVRAGLPISDIDAEYPAVGAFLMADQLPRPIDIEAHSEVVKTNGDTALEPIAQFPISRSALLDAALVVEIESVIPGATIREVRSGQEDVGDILMLGSAEAGSELVMLDSYDSGSDEWTVVRGLWDTIPLPWPVGSRLWAFPDGSLRADPNQRIGGEERTYRFLPKTNFGRLAYSEAADIEVTFTERPHLPFRPADAQLDGTGFAGVNYAGVGTQPATITATWANRNRQFEDQVANRWDDATATPESGQTTVLRFYDMAGVFSHEITGLSGTEREINIAEFDPVEAGWIEFVSERDGLRSWTGIRIPFDIREAGYGVGYGESYGP